jgi:hypothetical protein
MTPRMAETPELKRAAENPSTWTSDRDSNRHQGHSGKRLKWLPLKTAPNRRSTKLWRKTTSPASNLRNRQFSRTAPLPGRVVLLGFLETLAWGGIGIAAVVAEGEELGSNPLRVSHRDRPQSSVPRLLSSRQTRPRLQSHRLGDSGRSDSWRVRVKWWSDNLYRHKRQQG